MPEVNTGWSSSYKMAGLSAWTLLAYSLLTMMSLILLGGMPETAQQGFDMLSENRLAGLLRLDLLTILVLPLYYLLFLGLYGALRATDGLKSLLAAVLGVTGVTLVLATPSAFSFLTLSDRFASATSDAQKTVFLAAGEAMLASDLWHGSGALMGGVLMQTATLLVSVLMVRGSTFNRATAWVGIVTHGLDLLHILVGVVFPPGGVVLMMVAGPLYLVWFPMLARDFMKMSRH